LNRTRSSNREIVFPSPPPPDAPPEPPPASAPSELSRAAAPLAAPGGFRPDLDGGGLALFSTPSGRPGFTMWRRANAEGLGGRTGGDEGVG
jgi:hypothetical protein